MTSIETTSVSCSCHGTPTKSLIQHVRTFSVSSKLLCADWNCSLLQFACTAVTIFIIQWTKFQIYSYIESQHNFKKNSVGQILGPHSAGPACTARLARPIVTPLTPPKGGTKLDFAIFSSKFQLLSKKVSYKVSLCENFQRQSCSYIIPLSNGP